MSEICQDCGTEIPGPKVLCELCEKRYVRCKHNQIEYHCETCKAEARMAEAIRLLESCQLFIPPDMKNLRGRVDTFLSANRGRG